MQATPAHAGRSAAKEHEQREILGVEKAQSGGQDGGVQFRKNKAAAQGHEEGEKNSIGGKDEQAIEQRREPAFTKRSARGDEGLAWRPGLRRRRARKIQRRLEQINFDPFDPLGARGKGRLGEDRGLVLPARAGGGWRSSRVFSDERQFGLAEAVLQALSAAAILFKTLRDFSAPVRDGRKGPGCAHQAAVADAVSGQAR